MRQVRRSVHLDFHGDGDLLLDLFRRAPRPLRDDLHVVVGNVGVSLDGKVMKGYGAPHQQKHRQRQHHEPIV